MPDEQPALAVAQETWSVSLHKTFRVLPSQSGSSNTDLVSFLGHEDGTPQGAVLSSLPYDAKRSKSGPTAAGPNPRRYRDLKQILEASGLVWDNNGCVYKTYLGWAVQKFLPHANSNNVGLLARHAALALNHCQLRNPTGAADRYSSRVEIFPCRFIWQAMLRLDNRLNSDELNRTVFRSVTHADLAEVVGRIRRYRSGGHVEALGAEVERGDKKDDRIIPVVCHASFGWTLIKQKVEGYYQIRPTFVDYLRSVCAAPVTHHADATVETYVKRLSVAACLPPGAA